MYVNNLTDVAPESCQTFRKYDISQQKVFENMEDLETFMNMTEEEQKTFLGQQCEPNLNMMEVKN